MNGTVRMAVNDKDTDWLRKILGNMNVTKSNRPYSPPEKTSSAIQNIVTFRKRNM